MSDLTPPHWSHDDSNEQHSLIASIAAEKAIRRTIRAANERAFT